MLPFLRLLSLGSACVVGSASVSCVRVTPATQAEQSMAASFSPPAGKGMVYVYRKPAVAYASMIPSFVWVDGKRVAKNKAGGFIAYPLAPGKRLVSAGATPQVEESNFTLQVKPGQTYFIRQQVKGQSDGTMMVPAGAAMVPVAVPTYFFTAELVPEATARQEIAKCRQVAAQP